MMLHWSAGELGARGLPKLTATELMALAVVSGLEVSDGDKRAMLDSWRKLTAAYAPSDPQPLVARVLERQRLKKENALLEALLQASKERTASSYRSLSDYLDGCTSRQ
jgi:hypothetical protein